VLPQNNAILVLIIHFTLQRLPSKCERYVMQAEAFAPNRFADEDPNGIVDSWLQTMVIPPRAPKPHRVALIAIWPGVLPLWIDYFIRAAAASKDKGRLHQTKINNSMMISRYLMLISCRDRLLHFLNREERSQHCRPKCPSQTHHRQRSGTSCLQSADRAWSHQCARYDIF
jgi:hypothetical protein